MTNSFRRIPLLAFLTVIVFASVHGQNLDRKEVERLYADVAENEKVVAACIKQIREEQIRKFGRSLPRISSHCYGGCPVKVVKPTYPVEAKRMRASGEVKVETIVNEKGDVIYARILRGRVIFHNAALAAARVSKYQPKVSCSNKPIKFRWTTTYRFRPDIQH